MKKFIWVLLTVALVGVILYSNIQQQKAQDNKRTVYAVLPLTGFGAFAMQDSVNAMKLYSKEHTSFNLVFIDSESQPTKAITAVQQKLLNETNPIVLSCIARISSSIIPIVSNKNGFTVAISTLDTPQVSENKNYQRISYSYQDVIKPQAEYMLKHYNKVAVVYALDDYGTKLNNEFRKLCNLPKKEVYSYEFSNNSLDVRSVITKVLSNQPEAVLVVGGIDAAYKNIFKELRQQDFHGAIFADMLYPVSGVKEMLGKDIGKIIFLAGDYDLEQPLTKKGKEIKDFCTKNGIKPSFLIEESLASLDLLNNLISNGKEVNRLNLTQLEGYGAIQLKDNGNSQHHFILVYEENGKIVPVESEDK